MVWNSTLNPLDTIIDPIIKITEISTETTTSTTSNILHQPYYQTILSWKWTLILNSFIFFGIFVFISLVIYNIKYNKNNDIYSRNSNYPENFIQLSEPSKLRGVDVVMLGITPFQYNPVSKELIVYRDIKVKVNFEGGNNQFGEDRLRSRYWDPILNDAVLNHSSLPKIDYSTHSSNSREEGCEYLIVTPDNSEFQ